MKWKTLAPISLFSVVFVSTIAPVLDVAAGQHYIAEIQGDVSVKRNRWVAYSRVGVGSALSPSDWLRVARGSSVRVVCSDWQIWNPPVGDSRVSTGCLGSSQAQSRIGPTRGGSQDSNLPYLISPRNTGVLPNQPLQLTWNPVSGATAYEVTINDLSRTVWATRVTEPSLVFTDIDSLQRGFPYSITIEATIEDSDQPRTAPDSSDLVTLHVLDDEAVQGLTAKLAQLDSLRLNGEAHTLALAYLYESYKLYQMALDAIAEEIAVGTQNVAIYQLQGDLYRQIGLELNAQTSYKKALELALINGDLSQQAELQEQIGKIALGLQDYGLAISYLTAAEVSYRQFLDISDSEVQSNLAELQSAIQWAQGRLERERR